MIAERDSYIRCYATAGWIEGSSPAGNNDHLICLRILTRNKVLLIHSAEPGLLPDGEMPEPIMLAYDDALGSHDVALDRRGDGILRCDKKKHSAKGI